MNELSCTSHTLLKLVMSAIVCLLLYTADVCFVVYVSKHADATGILKQNHLSTQSAVLLWVISLK